MLAKRILGTRNYLILRIRRVGSSFFGYYPKELRGEYRNKAGILLICLYAEEKMEQEEILNKLKVLLNQRFSIDMSQLDESSRLGDLGLDSMHLVDIMLDIEGEMNFSFQSIDLPSNPSLGDMSKAIAAASSKK